MKPRYATIAFAAGLLAMTAISGQAEELVKFKVTGGMSIEMSLTGAAGDPAKGRETAINRKLGNCLACHKLPVPEQPFHGEIAPDLTGVGSRYSEGELRLRVVDSKMINPDSFMPAFYRADGFHRPIKKFVGKSILSAGQVEDIVAYLVTLKE